MHIPSRQKRKKAKPSYCVRSLRSYWWAYVPAHAESHWDIKVCNVLKLQLDAGCPFPEMTSRSGKNETRKEDNTWKRVLFFFYSSDCRKGLGISSLPSAGEISTINVPRATIRPIERVVVLPSSSVGVSISRDNRLDSSKEVGTHHAWSPLRHRGPGSSTGRNPWEYRWLLLELAYMVHRWMRWEVKTKSRRKRKIISKY